MGATGIAAVAVSSAFDQPAWEVSCLYLEVCTEDMPALCQPSMALDEQGRARAAGAAGDVGLAGSPLAPASAPGTGASLLCGLVLLKEGK